jgi:hypothetical protein
MKNSPQQKRNLVKPGGITTRDGQLIASKRHTHGPEPERLKIYGDWKEAVRLAMRKPKPAGGWPK